MPLTERLADLFIALCKRLAHTKRVIMDRDGAEPYLTRWYLVGKPATRDGAGGKWSLYLHEFHKSDSPEAMHNHPWRWALSLVLKGGYFEFREKDTGKGTIFWLGPGTFNFLRHDTFHRVVLGDDYFRCARVPAYTLFLAGPRIQEWGFLPRRTRKFVPWRTWLGIEPHTPEDV